MGVALSIFGVAFAAICVWLTVRIVNRRERWAKWTLAGTVIGAPALYVLSFGPACWIVSRTDCGHTAFTEAYRPIGCAVWKSPQFIWLSTWAYARWGMARGHNLFRYPDANGNYGDFDGFVIAVDNVIDIE
jgi:hypothetical protein